MEKGKYKRLLHQIIVAVLDLLIVGVGGAAALVVRFEFSFAAIPEEYGTAWVHLLPVMCGLMLAIFIPCRMYCFVWREVGLHDVVRMFLAVAGVCIAQMISGVMMAERLPRSVWMMLLLLEAAGFITMRCMPRIYADMRRYFSRSDWRNDERILLIGGGTAGRMLVQESVTGGRNTGCICAIIDDNSAKWGKYIEGVRIIGGRDKLFSAVDNYRITQIILAIPSATAAQQRMLLELCRQTGCRVRTVPGLSQMMNGEVSMSQVRDVEIEDLLGREPVLLNNEAVKNFITGKVVLVTGGGGSIGSELCRQITCYRPKKLIILDIYENNAYDIQQELRRTCDHELDLCVEIASVRDKEKVYRLFDTYHPQIVFHAAAHKHVPLMENCAAEAVKNNVFGTYHVVRAAEKFGVEKFVMISTDKAVNPTNVMGATKRFCEMILQSRMNSATEFCAVRFGNVLGSNGSVVPLFKRQIAEGGPVTVTDKRIIRYFMTIPEAASLVLEASAMAKKGQVFVLDMGEPVKILDLAENLIRLSGLTPYRDIDIVEVGLRPGEKLYEELLMADNDLIATENKKIFVEQQSEINRAAIMTGLTELDKAVTAESANEDIVRLLRALVPTYRNPVEVNTGRMTRLEKEA